MVKILRRNLQLYRAVSIEELTDIKINGFRIINGGYEFGKLFAHSYVDAVEYAKIIFLLDDKETVIIRVNIPDMIRANLEYIPADGMDAVLIKKNDLSLLKIYIVVNN